MPQSVSTKIQWPANSFSWWLILFQDPIDNKIHFISMLISALQNIQRMFMKVGSWRSLSHVNAVIFPGGGGFEAYFCLFYHVNLRNLNFPVKVRMPPMTHPFDPCMDCRTTQLSLWNQYPPFHTVYICPLVFVYEPSDVS